MSDATLRTAMKTMLLEIPGVGKVYDYERWNNDMAAFIALFLNEDKKIYGWEITRVGVPAIARIGSKYKVTHSYRFKGYYGLQDSAASEKSFNAIVDAVILKFISKKIAGSELHTVPTVGILDARLYGSVLCHYAEVNIQVPELVTPASDETIVDLLSVGLNYYLQEPADETADATDEVTLQT